jgi:NUMOD4 motif
MIRMYANEVFREIEIGVTLKYRYAVSNRGRLISFTENFNDGTLLKGAYCDGYKTFRFRKTIDGVVIRKTFFVYKLVAELFIPKTSEEQQYVLHLDYVRDNDLVANLKWATLEENLKSDGRKLTITKVMHLKILLKQPNNKTRIKMLAKQFGISEMQVHRIKTGENWGYIKV